MDNHTDILTTRVHAALWRMLDQLDHATAATYADRLDLPARDGETFDDCADRWALPADDVATPWQGAMSPALFDNIEAAGRRCDVAELMHHGRATLLQWLDRNDNDNGVWLDTDCVLADAPCCGLRAAADAVINAVAEV